MNPTIKGYNLNLDTIHIVKNNGEREIFDAEKIHKHLHFACQNLDVDIISIIKDARLKIFDGAKSVDIQDSLIKSAQEKISEDSPDYELVAGRLLNQKLRKEVYKQYTPLDFKSQVKERIKKGFYTEDLNAYSDEELDYFGSLINYELDNELPYSALNQMYSKYLIKHNKKCIEVPQEVFILIPMAIFYNTDIEYRKKYIKLGYELLSQRKISLPTPIMNGARTSYKKFISCNLLNFGDSVESFARGLEAVLKCTSAKSGLGINTSFIRGLGAPVGKPSRLAHTGMLPIVKAIEAATSALVQIGRGGCHSPVSEVLVVDSIIVDGAKVDIQSFIEANPNFDFTLNIILKKKKIEDVIPGDYVKSFDIDNNKECIKRVTDIFRPIVKKEDQRIIEFSDGGKIINSKDHPILVKRGNNYEYKKFQDLLIGDIVLNENGTASITALKNESIDTEQFCDLEVAETHNFYAGINGVYCSHNSSNLSMPFFHYEIELFSQLGDSKGSLENRARHTDQTIIINKWFLEKALNKEDIFLFHMNAVGNKDPKLDLYDALGDYKRFDELYNYYSAKVPNKSKKKINAYDLLSLIINERMITGRVYIVFADNFVNSSFKENLYMTNLCCLAGDTIVETSNGTKQLKDIKKGDLVLSYNQDTKKYEYKEVLAAVLTNPEAEVFEVEFNGKVVTCTGDHKFLTQRGYIEAQHLLESDTIVECSSHI